MKYEYAVHQAPGLDIIKKFGDEGWELVSVDGGTAYFKKEISTSEKPKGCAKVCANCKCFTAQADKEASIEATGMCSDWKLAMTATGSCEKFVEKEIMGAVKSLPAGSVPDEVSAWHWQPRTEFGEKRVEAITSQEAGANSPDHKHRVVVIRDKNGKVVRGKTDMVNGHDHPISFMGMADEADGHTHTFELPQGQ
jgi:hypothetical protein